MSDDLWAEVAALKVRIEKLEAGRSGGRTGKQILIKSEGICGLQPSRDSSICPDASLHYRRKGCLGVACKQASSEYYKSYARDQDDV